MSSNAFTIPSPATPEGPCRGSCNHAGCLAAREMAGQRCPVCWTPLGFGAKVIGEPPMHYRCAQQAALKARTSTVADSAAPTLGTSRRH
jgi:hypothetical protein